MTTTLKPLATLTATDVYDMILIGRGIFPPLPALTDEQRRRVKRWASRLTEMSLGYIDTEPVIAEQSRRLAEFFETKNVVDLCELAQCRTGTKYPK